MATVTSNSQTKDLLVKAQARLQYLQEQRDRVVGELRSVTDETEKCLNEINALRSVLGLYDADTVSKALDPVQNNGHVDTKKTQDEFVSESVSEDSSEESTKKAPKKKCEGKKTGPKPGDQYKGVRRMKPSKYKRMKYKEVSLWRACIDIVRSNNLNRVTTDYFVKRLFTPKVLNDEDLLESAKSSLSSALKRLIEDGAFPGFRRAKSGVFVYNPESSGDPDAVKKAAKLFPIIE